MTLACLATCSKGLEAVLAQELAALGLPPTPQRGAVAFSGSWEDVARANLWLRTAHRVLVELARGTCGNRQDLYQLAFSQPWEDILPVEGTLAVKASGRHPAFANTHFAELVVKDAIVDRLRARRGSRPSVDLDDPYLRVMLHLESGTASLCLDTSGETLAHRGYRQKEAPAPLSETLAAGLLLLAGYDGNRPLLDPMCGSATILVEAVLIACGRPPSARHRFAFQRWPFVDRSHLERLLQEAEGATKPLRSQVVGFDVDARALAAARGALRAARVSEAVTLQHMDIRRLPPQAAGTLIISNPPYGVRLGQEGQLRALYRAFGDQLKAKAWGCEVWLLLGNRELAREIGLKPRRKHTLYNGPLRCQFCLYPIVEGPYRLKNQGAVPAKLSG